MLSKQVCILCCYQWRLYWHLNKIQNGVDFNLKLKSARSGHWENSLPREYSHKMVVVVFSLQKCDTLEVNKLLVQKPEAAAELIPFTRLQQVGCVWKVSLTMWQNRCEWVCESLSALCVYHGWWGENNPEKNICFRASHAVSACESHLMFFLKKN